MDPPRIPDGPVSKGEPVPIFFPPFPPALDEPILRGLPGDGTKLAAPIDLSPYVSEIFYPPLGARMARGTYPSRLRRKVEAYRADELELLEQLRGELARIAYRPPEERRAALEEFARKQAAPLAALEKVAEDLRRDLIQLDSGWHDMREWFFRAPQRLGFSPTEVSRVMRAAAFYFPMLLPAQRRLLRETAFELSQAVQEGDASKDAASQVFFSPEMARVTMPPNLSPAATEKLVVFEKEKARLKKELYDAIYHMDLPGLNLLRNRRLKELAENRRQH